MHLIVSIYLVTVVPMHKFHPALSLTSATQQTKNWNKFWFWAVNVRISFQNNNFIPPATKAAILLSHDALAKLEVFLSMDLIR